jgi:hypothetical protein
MVFITFSCGILDCRRFQAAEPQDIEDQMLRLLGHGESTRVSAFTTLSTALATFKASAGLPPPGSSFGYMFGDLQKDPANRLPPTSATVLALKQLAETMTDMPEQVPGNGADGLGDSNIPAAYTYFGQFLDHDITFDRDGLAIEPRAM